MINNGKILCKKAIIIAFVCFLTSCFKSNSIYVDIKKNAIVSCDGQGLKEIKIENESESINLEGTEPVIYFNKKNHVAKTSVYGEVVYDYVLKLKPNSNYTITKYNGYDRGPIEVTFRTDGIGRVTETSDEKCD
jgi:hypothetical protein